MFQSNQDEAREPRRSSIEYVALGDGPADDLDSDLDVVCEPYPPTGTKAPITRRLSSSKTLWKTVLALAALLLALSIFIATVVFSAMHIKKFRSTFRVVPPLTDEQLAAATSRHMTHEQCNATYPSLFDEADRIASYWEQQGGVTMEQVDEASTHGETSRVLIKNGEMYVKHIGWERGSRTRSSLALINDAVLTSVEPIPDIEFVIHTYDAGDATGHLPLFVLDRKASQEHLWLMPDFGFNSWPEPKVGSYSEVVRKAHDFDAAHPWQDKAAKLFWRGALMVDIRRKLVDLAKAYPWGKIEDIDWGNKETVMRMDQHCGFKYLAHIEGWAYSGRLKYLLQCKSVVVAHEMDYLQHFHHLMNSNMSSPEQNIVVIPGKEWETLPATMDMLIEKDDFAQALAERSQRFWNHYISKQSIDCYWRALFHRYAQVQRFKPELRYEDTPYVSFSLMGKTDWDPGR